MHKNFGVNIVRKIMIYIILILGSITFLIPFLWMVSTSLKEPGAVFVFPPQWTPKVFYWENYYEVWIVVPFNTF